MRVFPRLLIVLPALLVLTGFGPIDWVSSKQGTKSLTHIPLENKSYLSKEEVEKQILEYQRKKLISISSPKRRYTSQPGAYIVSATAYSSTVDQCDASPFITASGQHVRDGIIATNFLPFGTRVKIPELYGDKVFEVQDRMNRRYQTRIDIWMPTRGEAIQFGVRRVKIEVL